jgi:hypothetical protein
LQFSASLLYGKTTSSLRQRVALFFLQKKLFIGERKSVQFEGYIEKRLPYPSCLWRIILETRDG